MCRDQGFDIPYIHYVIRDRSVLCLIRNHEVLVERIVNLVPNRSNTTIHKLGIKNQTGFPGHESLSHSALTCQTSTSGYQKECYQEQGQAPMSHRAQILNWGFLSLGSSSIDLLLATFSLEHGKKSLR